MTNNTKEWLWVLSGSMSILMLIAIKEFQTAWGALYAPIALGFLATDGVFSGIKGIFQHGFNKHALSFLLMLSFAIGSIGLGFCYRQTLWGKIVVVIGIGLWCRAGFEVVSIYV